MQIGRTRLLSISTGLIIVLAFQGRLAAFDTSAPAASNAAVSTKDVPIEFWNREIVVLRTTIAGADSETRAERVVEHLKELPLNTRGRDITVLPFNVEGLEGMAFEHDGRVLFFLSTGDLDKESGETLEEASQRAVRSPWRQVEGLLLLAADRTPSVRKQPGPYVLQRQLSDFYVAYTLIARITDAKRRIEILSDLHAHVQDAFNEFGVQIMSPHFMMQPQGVVGVPPSKWHAPPAVADALGPGTAQRAQAADAGK